MIKGNIESFLKKARENRHDDAVKYFLTLDESDKLNHLVMMAYADSLYELGKDVISLDAYTKCAFQHPDKETVNFALFGAALALKNLDLQDDAFQVLKMIDPGHEGLAKEIEHSLKILNEQKKAKESVEKLRKLAAGPPTE